MKDSEEENNCVTETGPGSGLCVNKSLENNSQHTTISIDSKHSHMTGKNIAPNSSRASLKTSSPSHKVSQDKISKSSSRKRIIRSKKTETPSKQATEMFSSMELCGRQEVSQPCFGASDTTMSDTLDNNKAPLNVEDPEESECFSECPNLNEIDKNQSMNGIEQECSKEMLWAQRSEYAKEIARTIGPDHPSIPTSFNSMEKSRKKYAGGPVDPNGRCKGRKLVLWHRPRMMEKLLLNIQYECFKAKLRIPWDEIVHRLEPGCSGPSAVQMLNKTRDILINEGHMIPPAMGNGIQPNPDVRGYVRDLESDIPGSTRILRWDENYPNASESRSESGFVRGSGNYRKVVTKGGAFNKIPRTIEERGYARKVIPEEAYGPSSSRIHASGKITEKANQTRLSRGKPRSLWKKPGPKIGSKSRSKSLPTSSSHPLDKLSDTGVEPQTEITYPSSANTSVRKHSMDGDIGFNNCNCAKQKLDFGLSSSEIKSAIKAEVSDAELGKNFCGQDENIKIRPPTSTIRVDTSLPVYDCNSMGNHLMHGANMVAPYVYNNEKLPETSMQIFLGEYSSKKTYDQQYKGVQEHGTLEDFARALASGTDPRINGWGYLNLAEMPGKMEGRNSVDHNLELSISSKLNSLPASDEFLEQLGESKRLEAFTRDFRQHHDAVSWIYPGINSERQVTKEVITDDISKVCDINQIQVYQRMNPDSLYSTEDENQYLKQSSPKVDKPENLDPLGHIFNSPKIIADRGQKYHFSSSDTIFEGTLADSPSKMSTQSRSSIPDFFGSFENIGSDDFQPSSWQN